MYRAFRRSAFAPFAVLLSVALFAQQSKTQLPVAAPIPAQITTAAKVFISNRGGDRTETLGEAEFDGGPDRPYNAFYAAMKSWGHYQLVSSPADADLVLEISWALVDTGLPRQVPVLGQLRLVALDPKTHVALWEVREYVRDAISLGNRDKNFDLAMNTVVERLKVLTTGDQSAAAEPTAP